MTFDLEPLFIAVELEPDEPRRWSVLADALCEASDPRGELLALLLAGHAVTDAERAPHLRALLGLELSRWSGLAWHGPFLDRVATGDTGHLSEFLAAPAGRLIKSLHVTCVQGSLVAECFERRPGRALALAVQCYGEDGLDLRRVTRASPRLRRLTLSGYFTPAVLEAASLRALDVTSEEADVVELLELNRFDQLAELHVGAFALQPRWSHLAPLLGLERFRALTTLGIRGRFEKLIEPLAQSPVAPRLLRLVLDGEITIEVIDRLVRVRPAFAALQRLEIYGDYEHSARFRERGRLRTRFPGLDVVVAVR